MKKFISLLFLCVLGNILLAVTESVNEFRSELAYGASTMAETASSTIGDMVTPASLYLVIDLSGGTSATSYPVTTLAAPPAGGWTDEYKTTKLVLRRIEAGSFKMSGSYDVTISKPFYMGVFEVTQKQYELVMGSDPSGYNGDARPVEGISWNTIRGDSSTYNWPSNQTVDANSFMGKLRAKTGLEVDLPTEAQWEYACRAGTSSKYNNGGDELSDLKTLGRYSGNRNDGRGGYSEHTKVGSYLPNAWGLYDMHGNVAERCLDWDEYIEEWSLDSSESLSLNTDPVGPSSGMYRVDRGGSWLSGANICTSSPRDMSVLLERGEVGFRLTCLAGALPSVVTITFDANGGVGGTSVNLEPGSALSAPTVTREGYTFTGWSPSVPEIVPATNLTYVAQWQANVYTIAYSANGGSGTMETTAVTYDAPVTIANNAFVREGYRFIGWATTAEGEVLYTGGESVSNLTAVQNGVVTLYAIWEEIPNTPEGPGGDEPPTQTSPNWSVGNYQYNMVVYASIQDAQGNLLEADGNLLAAFDADGVCRGVIEPLDIGIGVKVYQLTVCSDSSAELGLTLKLWDAATSTVYDVDGTINFAADTEIGLLWEPKIYTVIETTLKYDVVVTVIGEGAVAGMGSYEVGEKVILKATPAEGNLFCGWGTTPIITTETYTFTMPETAVTLTAYFAPVVALNNYIADQDFVAEDAVNAKIQEYIEENDLKTPEEVEVAIDAHVASNGLLTPAEANQQTQDYIADNKLMSKDEAKQELLDDDEVFTEDEMKELALGAPVIKVKDGVATVSIQVQKASELNGEWEVVEDGEVSVQIAPKAGEKAGFYKFVVPNKQ